MLLATVKIALPPPGINAADLPDGSSPGAVAVARYCTQCHDLPSPTMHSSTDWPGVLRRMWLRMDRMPANFQLEVPDEGSRSEMLSYLLANSLQVSTNLAAGPGQQEFARICSRCHALPDPRIHSSKDWLAVFLRMERNMERMKVIPATKVETEKILGYLQNTAPAP
jgi:cytochrome c5